jgi:hypothetical protein
MRLFSFVSKKLDNWEFHLQQEHVLGGQGKSFMSLAKYIGVMSTPENDENKKISMTVRLLRYFVVVVV